MCTQDRNIYTCGHEKFLKVQQCVLARKNKGRCPREILELPAKIRAACEPCEKHKEEEAYSGLDEKMQTLQMMD
jgi:hypothetical protein